MINKNEIKTDLIIHCNNFQQVEELINTFECAGRKDDALSGWGKYGDKVCYAIKCQPEPTIIYYCSINDVYIKGQIINEFSNIWN